MARRGEGHLLFQADLNKQLCNKCIINKKLIIPVRKHFTCLVSIGASWLLWKALLPLSEGGGEPVGWGGVSGGRKQP